MVLEQHIKKTNDKKGEKMRFIGNIIMWPLGFVGFVIAVICGMTIAIVWLLTILIIGHAGSGLPYFWWIRRRAYKKWQKECERAKKELEEEREFAEKIRKWGGLAQNHPEAALIEFPDKIILPGGTVKKHPN